VASSPAERVTYGRARQIAVSPLALLGRRARPPDSDHHGGVHPPTERRRAPCCRRADAHSPICGDLGNARSARRCGCRTVNNDEAGLRGLRARHLGRKPPKKKNIAFIIGGATIPRRGRNKTSADWNSIEHRAARPGANCPRPAVFPWIATGVGPKAWCAAGGPCAPFVDAGIARPRCPCPSGFMSVLRPQPPPPGLFLRKTAPGSEQPGRRSLVSAIWKWAG